MMKRITWFAGGLVAGVAGAGVAKRKVKQAASSISPARLARGAVGRVGDAVGEGRRAMRGREAELRARYAGIDPSPLAAELEPDDAVLFDGELIDADKVVVLRQSRPVGARRGRRA